MSQNSIDTDLIEKQVNLIDSIIKESRNIKTIYIKSQPNPFLYGDKYIRDISSGRLVKVSHKELFGNHYLIPSVANDSTNPQEVIVDTLSTNYYFFNDSLIKVVQMAMKSHVLLEFYFKSADCIYKVFTAHGSAFIIADETQKNYFLESGRDYIKYYKASN